MHYCCRSKLEQRFAALRSSAGAGKLPRNNVFQNLRSSSNLSKTAVAQSKPNIAVSATLKLAKTLGSASSKASPTEPKHSDSCKSDKHDRYCLPWETEPWLFRHQGIRSLSAIGFYKRKKIEMLSESLLIMVIPLRGGHFTMTKCRRVSSQPSCI